MKRSVEVLLADARQTLACVAQALSDASRRRLWLGALSAHMAQAAVAVGVLVVVYDATDSAASLSGALLAFLLPAALLRLAAERVTPRLAPRHTLIAGYALSAVLVLLIVFARDRLALLYVWCFLLSAVARVLWRGEAAAVEGAGGEAMCSETLVSAVGAVSHVIGIVLIAPLVIKLTGSAVLLAVAAALLAAAAVAIAAQPDVAPVWRAPAGAELVSLLRGAGSDARRGWGIVRDDWRLARALSCQTLAGVLGGMLAALAPVFAAGVMRAAPEDAAYLLAAAIAGALAALAVLRQRTSSGTQRALARSVLAVGVALTLLGVAKTGGSYLVYNLLSRITDTRGAAVEAPMVLGLSCLLGFVGAALWLEAGAIVARRWPQEWYNRLPALRSTLIAASAVLPLAAMGGAADLLGVNKTLTLLGLTVVVAGVIAVREWELDEESDC